MELHPCQLSERQSAIALARSVFKPNMGEQFLSLFSERNLAHMFVAVENGEVVSMVNYYPATVKIYMSDVTTASVGAVCTKLEDKNWLLAYCKWRKTR
jgi:hypothetical protein